MATKKRTVIRLSCFFENGQSKHFDLDPKTDELKELAKELVVKRGDATKMTTKIDRSKLCFYVVSKEIIEVDPTKHPAFQNLDSEDIDLRG